MEKTDISPDGEDGLTEEELIRVLLGFMAAMPLAGMSVFSMLGGIAIQLRSPIVARVSVLLCMGFCVLLLFLCTDAFRKDSIMRTFVIKSGRRYIEWMKSRS